MKILKSMTILTIPISLFSIVPYEKMGCYDLWYARNYIFDNFNYCFKSTEAILIFKPKCYEDFQGLDKAAKEAVDKIINIEKTKGCTKNNRFRGVIRPSILVKNDNRYMIRKDINNLLAIRLQPDINGKVIDFLFNSIGNIKILGYSKNKQWAYIEYSNFTDYKSRGWINKKYLKKESYNKNELSYKDKFELFKKIIDNQKCSDLEKNIIDKYLHNDRYKYSFYDDFQVATKYDCKYIKNNKYQCSFYIIDWINVDYSWEGESGSLGIDFIIEKDKNHLQIDKVNRCMYSE